MSSARQTAMDTGVRLHNPTLAQAQVSYGIHASDAAADQEAPRKNV